MEMISSHDPTLMVKERGPTPQDGLGALERRDDATSVQSDERGMPQLVWQLGRQLDTTLIVPGQGKSRSSQIFFLNF